MLTWKHSVILPDAEPRGNQASTSQGGDIKILLWPTQEKRHKDINLGEWKECPVKEPTLWRGSHSRSPIPHKGVFSVLILKIITRYLRKTFNMKDTKKQ